MIKVICDISGTASNTNTPSSGDRDFIDTAWLEEEEDVGFEFGNKMDTSGRRVYEIFVDG